MRSRRWHRRLSRIRSALGTLSLAVAVFALNVACAREPGETGAAATDPLPEVLVFTGPEDGIEWMRANGWWGGDWHEIQLQAPRVLITAIGPAWRANAERLPVATKKEMFYRVMLPLVLHANEIVLERRARLERGRATLAAGGTLSADELKELQHAAVLFRVVEESAAAGLAGHPDRQLETIDELLYRLDIVPPGLALGQAAYESGYATSRFAGEGNALFGQWTYGGEGMLPGQQRKQLGDHRIAAYEWPFDSVRAYFINLMSHPAYEDFRRLRAERRAAGKPLSSLELADGLVRYSERGQDYVDTLKGIIRTNHLDAADNARLRDEPLRLSIGAQGPEAAESLRAEFKDLRTSGELAAMVERMRLY